jgi:2-amino-4-hydroxy-6-hydroxymethyldihydropteridine diphosphokinase
LKKQTSEIENEGCFLQHRNDGMAAQSCFRGRVLVGLGANCPGPWGTPPETFARALRELERRGVRIEAVSGLYETAALGSAGQAPYRNAVALVATNLPAQALLRLLKRIEARAGRRGGRPWGSRTLDLDILDYKGMRLNWSKRQTGQPRRHHRPLVLPHPGIAERPFVLRPLLDVAPDWRHPVTKESAKALWRRVGKRGQGGVLARVDWTR